MSAHSHRGNSQQGQSHPCHDFRGALSRALEGKPQPAELAVLAWHEHLLGCRECRELLEREEALEMLLATLPEPKLPPDLTRRVVKRLDHEVQPSLELDALLELDGATVPVGLAARVEAGARGEAALDALLDRDEVEVPQGLSARVILGVTAKSAAELDAVLDRDVVALPEGLAERVLAGAQAASERELDALLEQDRVELPVGLSTRVLAGLEQELVPQAPKRGLRLLRSPVLYAAAAGILVLIWVGGLDRSVEPTRDELAHLEGTQQPEPDPEMLEMMDVLERDELWADTITGSALAMNSADLDILLCEELDSDDELLLAYLEQDGLGR